MLQLDFAAVVFQVAVAHVLGHRVKVVVHRKDKAQFSVHKPTVNHVNLKESPQGSQQNVTDKIAMFAFQQVLIC